MIAASPTGTPRSLVLAASPSNHVSSAPVAIHSIPRSPPKFLSISAIDLSTTVGALGLQPNGQVMVPNNTRTVSWFRYGPTPGQFGSSVILGHVDSYTGPGVFFELKTLKPGAIIKVTLADGKVASFIVVKVVQYSKLNFPDRLVYGSRGAQLLNLVTCGGVFDHQTGNYESNIVVFSRLTNFSTVAKS